MKLILLATAIPLIAGLSVSAAQLPSPPPEVAAQTVQVDHYPAGNVTFPNGVTGVSGVVYSARTGYRPLTLDLYLPPKTLQKPAHGFPLVVYIHGGGWLGGDSHHSGTFVDFPGVLASLSLRGYVVASVNYRLSSEAKFPAPVQHVKAAIRWLRSRASEYAIDPTRVMAWGASAGGHLAALTAVSCGALALEPPQESKVPILDGQADTSSSSNVSDCVQGSVIWYGVFDIATIAAQAREG